MHSHLVSVEVRVERGTYQRMQLDGLALYQDRLKCLDTQTVQGRRAVQHNRMLFDHILQHIPYLGLHLALYHLLRALNIMGSAVLHQLLHHEGLEQLDGHLLGQTALVNLKLGANHDNGTSGVVYTLSEQVLTETSRFSLEHIRQGLQGPVARPCHGAATAAVVNQGVHRLLEHTLLIADDDIRRAQLQQSLQTVIAVDNSSV